MIAVETKTYAPIFQVYLYPSFSLFLIMTLANRNITEEVMIICLNLFSLISVNTLEYQEKIFRL